MRAFNNSGALAGSLHSAANQQHAFLNSDGVIRDLGTLGGPASVATALNDDGDTVGHSDTSDFSQRAFLFRNGALLDLGTLSGGTFSTAVAINNPGDVLGESETGDFGYRGFLYRDGRMIDLGSLGGGASSVFAMNNHGVVVGESLTDVFETHAFLFTNGSIIDLGTLGGRSSSARAINDSGLVAGESTDRYGNLRAFLYSNGAMQDLGTLGGRESAVYAINSSGGILGASLLPGDQYYHAFLFSNGRMVDLGTLGGRSSTGYDLNNFGDVVGETDHASGAVVPFLWRNGSMIDLNTLLPPNSGWRLATARYINDAGHVVGFGLHNGEFAWYLLKVWSENHPPVAVAGPDQTIECGSSARLDGSRSRDPDGDALTFEWRAGATVLGNEAVLNVNPASGTYHLTLKVTDAHGAMAEDSVILVVRDTTVPAIDLRNNPIMIPTTRPWVPIPNIIGYYGYWEPHVYGQNMGDFFTSGFGYDPMMSIYPPPGADYTYRWSEDVEPWGRIDKVRYNPQTDSIDVLGVLDPEYWVPLFQWMLYQLHESHPNVFPAPMQVAPRRGVTVAVGSSGHAIVPDFTAALVVTDNCTPASELVKRQTPGPGTRVGLGSHEVTLTVTDAAGNRNVCLTTVHVVDNTPPVLVAPAPVTTHLRAGPSAKVPDFVAGVRASDNGSGDVVVTQSPAAGILVGRGAHVVTLTATDASGNRASCTTTFNVVDSTAPVIHAVSVSPRLINNPNRSLVPITVAVNASDNCDTVPVSRILSITSDEPGRAPGDNTSPDWVVGRGLSGKVRAERSVLGDGRVYTITVVCTDASGNSSTASTTVLVPNKRSVPNSKAKAMARLPIRNKRK